MNKAYFLLHTKYPLAKGILMKLFVTALLLTFSQASFAANVCCSWGVDQRWCMKGCRDVESEADAIPYSEKIGMTTIEKILLMKPNGEEVESALCCSWTSTNTNCVPTCIIEDGKIIPTATLPPREPPKNDVCLPGSVCR